MSKKTIAALLSTAILFSTAAFAEATPEVYVDGAKVIFNDQQPIIENDRILIPARGVMEATGAKVSWHPKSSMVQIISYDSWDAAEVRIDSDILKLIRINDDLMSSTTTEYKLDVPAKLLNDRTLIPLKAVNDAFKYETKWDDETKTAYVNTTRQLPTGKNSPEIYLTADKENIKKGDTVNVFLNVKNFDKSTADAEHKITGVTAGIIYDKSKLELNGATICNNDVDISGLGATNADYDENELKAVSVTVDEDSCLGGDGAFYKITFTALSDDCGTVALSNKYHTRLGYDTTFVLSKDSKTELRTQHHYYINTTPLEIK